MYLFIMHIRSCSREAASREDGDQEYGGVGLSLRDECGCPLMQSVYA